MITLTWDNLAPLSTTWDEFTFNTPGTTWDQIFNSYQITNPGIEVVYNLNNQGSCTTEEYLPTIEVYDTDVSNESSSENTSVIKLLNNGCHIGLSRVSRVSLVFPDDSYISSQTIPAQIYWDDWFIYMQLGKNDLWNEMGEGYYRARVLVRMDYSNVHFFWGFIRIKVLLGGESI